jgi:HSP20 family protein
MATQTTQSTQQGQQSQGQQAVVRGSQGQMEHSRRGRSAAGFLLTPADFFQMNPFSLMRRMTEELDRTFGEASRTDAGDRAWAPAVEVTQRDNNFIVRAEIPGMNADEVNVIITDDVIVIEGERKMEQEEDTGGIRVTERRYGRFYRAIPLPDGAKADEATARYENGVLEVVVPTGDQPSRRREIPVQAGSSQQAGSSSEQSAKPSDGKAA